ASLLSNHAMSPEPAFRRILEDDARARSDGVRHACGDAHLSLRLSGNAASVFAPMLNGSIVVNTEVVLAVDVSASMTPDEQALQREGYVHALSSHEFMQALKANGNGRISITYFEWANVRDQKIILPWRLIDGPEAARAVAVELARAPYRRSS